MRTICRASILVVLFVAGRVSADELLADPDVIRIFGEVLRRGQFGFRDTESAAFIVAQPDGSHRCVPWPETAQYHATRYRRPLPPGVVAIVHTHPPELPRVSGGDIATAVQLRVPVFAITLYTISVAETTGRAARIVRHERWMPERSSLCSQREPRLPRAGPELDLTEVCGGRLAFSRTGELRPCEW
jgi:hypothetical protein